MPDNTQQHTLQLSLGLNLWIFWFQVSVALSQKCLGEVDQLFDGRNFDFQYSNDFFHEAMNSSCRVLSCVRYDAQAHDFVVHNDRMKCSLDVLPVVARDRILDSKELCNFQCDHYCRWTAECWLNGVRWAITWLGDPLGGIQVLHNAMGWGVWISNNYEGVPSTVNSIIRRCQGGF